MAGGGAKRKLEGVFYRGDAEAAENLANFQPELW
jgi:hypothetical protein